MENGFSVDRACDVKPSGVNKAPGRPSWLGGWRRFAERNATMLVLLASCLVPGGLAGCSGNVSPTGPQGSVKGDSPFRTARYAHVVPIPSGIRLQETLVGPSHDLGGTPQMDAVVWVFRHDRSMADLKAYYRSVFPTAEMQEFELDGAATELTIQPTGARPHEEVVVTIRAGELQVRETLAPVSLDRLAADVPEGDDRFRR